jgi:hypothetical protein
MYDLCFFYAERANAHKGAAYTGTVLIVAKAPRRNGACVEAVATPKGQPAGVPASTWVNPSHLAKRCSVVSEETARRIAPSMFEAVERNDRAPEYRTMRVSEVARAYVAGTYTMQPAEDAIVAAIAPSQPVEVADSRGFAHPRR